MFSSYLESLTMVKVHKPSDSECYTSESELFTFYQHGHIHYRLFKTPNIQETVQKKCGSFRLPKITKRLKSNAPADIHSTKREAYHH
jgi:hypothetical protein